MATTLRFCDDESTNDGFLSDTLQAVISGITLTVLTCICCYFYYKLCKKREDSAEIALQYKLLCIFFTISAFVDVITTFVGKIGCIYSLSMSIMRWPAGITLVSHEIGLFCLVILFLIRIEMTFNSTPYKPSKRHLQLIYGLIIFIIVLVTFATLVYRLSKGVGLFIGGIAGGIFFIVEICVVRLFIVSLRDVCTHSVLFEFWCNRSHVTCNET